MDGSLILAGPRAVLPEELTAQAPIVVLAPHPDDESLGCGALLSHAFANHGANVVCMTDGSASHPGSVDWPPERLSAARRVELGRAVACLGGSTKDVTWLDHPDGWLGAQNAEALAARIVAICQIVGARTIFSPAEQDHHEDHRATARIARLVALALPTLHHYAYPVWSRHDDPNLIAHIAPLQPLSLDPDIARAAKRAAIMAHETQLGRVVRDDPAGFALPPSMVEFFVEAPELYWRVPA